MDKLFEFIETDANDFENIEAKTVVEEENKSNESE